MNDSKPAPLPTSTAGGSFGAVRVVPEVGCNPTPPCGGNLVRFEAAPVTVFAIVPAHNSGAKKDTTGAFQPEAREFVRIHGGTIAYFDNRRGNPERFAQTMASFESVQPPVEVVAFFCHGFKSGLQCGANNANVQRIAAAISGTMAKVVVLYACDAARDADLDRADDAVMGPAGAGGFASRLAKALEGSSVRWVDAHITTAHTTINPHVRRFYTTDATDGGVRLIRPDEGATWRAWVSALRDDRAFRLSFPMMTSDEIRARLRP